MVGPSKERAQAVNWAASATMLPLTDPRVPLKELRNYGPTIRVNVGKDQHQKSFHVHETLLRERSLFFDKALSRDWKEAVDREVNLPEDGAVSFAIYVNFLYTGNFAVISESSVPESSVGSEFIVLCKVYVLAEKLQDINAKNRAIQGLLFGAKQVRPGNRVHYPGLTAINIIYDGTPPESMARKLLVDFYTYRGTGSWIINYKGWPDDFLVNLATNLMDKRMIPDDPTKNGDGAEYMETKGDKIGT